MAKKQLHKRFTTEQVKTILIWYTSRTLSVAEARERLEISERRFFDLLATYRNDPDGFSIGYPKRQAHNRLDKHVDAAIRKELEKEKRLIENKNMPITTYNYAAVRDAVAEHARRKLSSETVRTRAHAWGFHAPKSVARLHDRIVMTSAPGQLLQHDASIHLWSPYAKNKWSLVTTLDDYSRKLLYADLHEEETAWTHIAAAESVILRYGTGLAYYVDNHRIFRFICHRDSIWRNEVKGTDDVMTQWKRAVVCAGMKVFYASSPEGKGKVERPYRWLQDRIVRQCAKDDIRTIQDTRTILRQEIDRYNMRQVHSTTGEIPDIRFHRATEEGYSVFKRFSLPSPYTSTKDIFCLTEQRKVNGYHMLSWRGRSLPVPKSVPEGAAVTLHIIPDRDTPEVRLWYADKVVAILKLTKRRP